jgi:hypothetical protein
MSPDSLEGMKLSLTQEVGSLVFSAELQKSAKLRKISRSINIGESGHLPFDCYSNGKFIEITKISLHKNDFQALRRGKS